MSDYWRFILCKENGSCNCFAKDSHPKQGKEDLDHRIVVSDVIRLVQDNANVLAVPPGMVIY